MEEFMLNIGQKPKCSWFFKVGTAIKSIVAPDIEAAEHEMSQRFPGQELQFAGVLV